MAYLVCLKTQQKYDLDHSPFTIGRSRDADIVCSSVAVSKNHCELRKDANGVWNLFVTCSSGTQINHTTVKVGAQQILNDCDNVKVGKGEEFQWKFINSVLQENITNLDKGKLIIEVERLRKALDERHKHCESSMTYQVALLQSIMSAKDLELKKMHREKAAANKRLQKALNEERKRCEQQMKEQVEEHEKSMVAMIKNLDERRAAAMNLERREFYEQLAEMYAKLDDSNQLYYNEKKTSQKRFTELYDQLKARDQLEKNLKELECGICKELFMNAITLNCTHTFCEYCLKEWKHKTCPYCRAEIVSQNRALAVDNFIQKVVDSSSSDFRGRRDLLIFERRLSVAERSNKFIPIGRERARRGRPFSVGPVGGRSVPIGRRPGPVGGRPVPMGGRSTQTGQ